MTYQEDVMNIARELAGYSLGEADLLRRAMGKKIASEMAVHEKRFVEGAGKKNILKPIAEQIFEQAAKFAGYGFNKGHAAAYAQVAYQTAFLKANYPVEFLAASMTLDIGNTDRLNIFRQEAQRLGVRVLPPDINRSESYFACSAEKGEIFYALAAVKGVGKQAMEHVVAVRGEGGPFRSIGDFARRIDPKFVNKRAFESLVRAGAFDALSRNRRQLVESSDAVLSDAARTARERETGQVSLFGEAASEKEELRLVQVDEWPAHEKLGEEFSAIGFYLSGHPLDNYRTALTRLQALTFAQIQDDRRSTFVVQMAGTIIRKSERRGRNDQSYAFVSFSDPSGMFEVMFFPEVLAATRPLLEAGKSVLLKLNASWEGDELKLRAISASDLEKAAADAGEGLKIYLEDIRPLAAIASQLRQPGKGMITLVVPGSEGREVEIKLPQRQQVSATLKGALKSLPGVGMVESI
jgi:DNA polymerase-3 subunit alpha